MFGCSSQEGTPDATSAGNAGTTPVGSGGSGGSASGSAGGPSAGSSTGGSDSAGKGGGGLNGGGTGPGTGGSGGAGGVTTAGSAGTTNASGGSTAGGAGGGSECAITATHTMSSKIPTVGIVEWSTGMAGVESAKIEFGLDTNYGMTAPVDLAEPNYRTLLLGMKTSRTYHYRVAVTAGGQVCNSQDYTLETGPPPNGIYQNPTIETPGSKEQLYGGYMITARWGMNNKGPAVILDSDGELVWWFPVEDDVIRMRMAYDGKHVWIRNTAQADGDGWVRRMTLDGLTEEKWDLEHTTHDLAVLPDGNVGLISHAADGCWEIMEFNPETEELKPLFNPSQAHGSTMCQVNYLAYNTGANPTDVSDDSFMISDYRQSTVIKITRQGELVWVLNGTNSDFTGTSWSGQHGIHILGPEHLLVFSNGSMGAGSESLVYELMLNTQTMVADPIWTYDGNLSTPFGGDVQRLDNGNTLVTFSSSGVIHEVNAAGELLQSFVWPINNSISYVEKRKSLYDSPPPKVHGL
jgi:hypothetical protein